jgi:hypothetical protein
MQVSALDAYFRVFSEGAEDAKFRQRALDVQRRVLEALRDTKPNELDVPKPGKNIASVNVGEVLGDPDLMDLELWFVMRDSSIPASRRAIFIGSKTRDEKRIEIYVDVPPNVQADMTSDVWKRIISKNGVKVFERTKEYFWHEFVHYMDFKRMSPTSRAKSFGKASKLGGGANPTKYFRDPVEFNAFVQQGLSRVEDHLKDARTKADAEKLIGKSVNDFYKLMLSVLTPGFAKNLDDRFKNKLKKRVAQMWTDTMNRFDGGKQNV